MPALKDVMGTFKVFYMTARWAGYLLQSAKCLRRERIGWDKH